MRCLYEEQWCTDNVIAGRKQEYTNAKPTMSAYSYLVASRLTLNIIP